MKSYKSNKTSQVTMIVMIVLILSVLTGCRSIESLLEENETYKEELDKKALDKEELSEDITFSDELIAADGLIINRELDYESFIGRRGQNIIEELLVVRRDADHRYGDVLSYNGNKFFCDQQDICYAVYVKKDKVLGLKYPIGRDKIVEHMGEAIISNDDYQYYQNSDFMIRVPAANNEVKEVVVAKNIHGLVAFMSSYNEESSYQLDDLLQKSKFDIMSLLGPSERETLGSDDVMHYDYQGIYVLLKGEESNKKAVKVLMTKYGGFGIHIGESRTVLNEFYIKPIVSMDVYIYQYEDTYYAVFFEDDFVIALQVMTEEEALLLITDAEPLNWADLEKSEE